VHYSFNFVQAASEAWINFIKNCEIMNVNEVSINLTQVNQKDMSLLRCTPYLSGAAGTACIVIGLSGVCVVGDRVQVLALPSSTG
jgi:hypothetical protein